MRAAWDAAGDQRQLAEFRRILLPTLMESEFGAYIFHKPRGYHGDFVSQEMIWFGRTLAGPHRYRGSSPVGKMLSAYTFDTANCRANEDRVWRLKRLVRKSGIRIASIGCGSCIELWGLTDIAACDLLLLDQDGGALARAKEKLHPAVTKVQFAEQNILKSVLCQPGDSLLGQRDFIYSVGLLDYFEEKSARRIVAGLWRSIAPGGLLLVTNAHPGNPTKLWMEYAGDWWLKYKDESAM